MSSMSYDPMIPSHFDTLDLTDRNCDLLIHFSTQDLIPIIFPFLAEETFPEMWQKIVDLLCDSEQGGQWLENGGPWALSILDQYCK